VFIIVKSSRLGSTFPYSGPTCSRAGVEPGKVYTFVSEAQRDAARLAAHNPVGFKVIEIAIRGATQ